MVELQEYQKSLCSAGDIEYPLLSDPVCVLRFDAFQGCTGSQTSSVGVSLLKGPRQHRKRNHELAEEQYSLQRRWLQSVGSVGHVVRHL